MLGFLAGLIGFLFGGAVTWFFNVADRAYVQANRRHIIARSIAAEISAYVRLQNMRNSTEAFGSMLAKLEAGEAVLLRGFIDDVNETPLAMLPFTEGHLGESAILGDVTPDLFDWLARYRAVRATARAAERGDYDALPLDALAAILRKELDIFRKVLSEVEALAERLNAIPAPSWKDAIPMLRRA